MGKVEGVLLHLLHLLKTDVEDYCDLETIDGGKTIVAMDGSMASILRFNGTKSVLGRDQFIRLIRLLEGSFSVFFKTRGHQLQVVFRRDLDATGTLAKNADQQKATAERLRLDLNDLVDESVERYANYVYDEDCYIVFWSRPSLLDPVEAKMATEALNEWRKEVDWPSMGTAQNLLRPITYLRDRHTAFCSKIADDLSSPEFGCSAEMLDVADALRAVRQSVLPDYTPLDWNPAIPGRPIPFRWKENGDTGDMSEFMYPTLSSQIMTATAIIGDKKNVNLPDETTVRLGSRAYAPVVFKAPPAEPEFFNALFNALNRAETHENGRVRAVPYSISFVIESDGMSLMTFKSLFASLLSVTSEQNRNINLATKALNERRRDGECIVKLRICAMTWAGCDASGIKELTLRKSKLIRTLTGWGASTLYERSGNPMQVLQANCVGMTPNMRVCDAFPAPLGDALSLLPLTRPASPFSTGSIIYRSLDGKILRYQRFSSEQTTWITLIAGKPGSGKSVLMNYNNTESCLMPGLTRLPYICVIDIGVSSRGFTDLIKDSLPEEQQHLVLYKRLQNSESDCINLLDLPLGMRAPLPKDRDYMKNVVTMIVTPPERQGKAYEGMSNFVGRVIDLAFQRKSEGLEKAQPEYYKPNHNTVIDEAVRRLGFPVKQATTYYELVDAMFDAGMLYEAEVTQRYAVPTLNDLVSVASSEEVAAEYGGMTIEGGRELIKTFMVGIREAVTDYPVFSGHTRFDIGSARIMAIDLQDVALMGSDAASKQTALMYMVSRQSFMKKVAFSPEDLPFFSDRYRPYYAKLITDIVDEYKVLCMDEFHKTGGHAALQQQVLTDGREARKWNLEIILASQLMEDFGALTKIATSMFVLDSGTEQTRRWMKENIGLNSVEEASLVNYVHGAGQHGATFLARFATKNSTFTQLFTMTAGPMRLWALSTTAEDRKLRGLLYEALPRRDARRLLAARFPRGSCKAAVERMKEEQFSGADFVDDDMLDSVIEQLAKSMIRDYYNQTV